MRPSPHCRVMSCAYSLLFRSVPSACGFDVKLFFDEPHGFFHLSDQRLCLVVVELAEHVGGEMHQCHIQMLFVCQLGVCLLVVCQNPWDA